LNTSILDTSESRKSSRDGAQEPGYESKKSANDTTNKFQIAILSCTIFTLLFGPLCYQSLVKIIGSYLIILVGKLTVAWYLNGLLTGVSGELVTQHTPEEIRPAFQQCVGSILIPSQTTYSLYLFLTGYGIS